MFEKVNPSHPDKIADRIAGALVDQAYKQEHDPRISVEILIGHGECNIDIEDSKPIAFQTVKAIVHRIAGKNVTVNLKQVPQDKHLADNQADGIKCGDNGIFLGMPITSEQAILNRFARDMYEGYPSDGKYLLDMKRHRLIVCQSHGERNLKPLVKQEVETYFNTPIHVDINPLGDWTGGINVDTGAVNRKLGSDLADSVTGGGINGKDLSKPDVAITIYAWLLAQKKQKPVAFSCAIGDSMIDGIPYQKIVNIARKYVHQVGGFEKLAEWGLY